MYRAWIFLGFTLVSISSLPAELPNFSNSGPFAAASGGGGAAAATETSIGPLSRVAIGGGISLNGINLQAATNVSRNFNVRAVGNVFKHDINNLSSKGFNGAAKLNFATFGASLDYYPFPDHGFRLSPGLLFYNQNVITGSGSVAPNQQFKLNGTTYYSSAAQPVQAIGALGLNARNPAFTMTVGWGNMISRTGGHWSFPFEFGAAFVGTPTLSVSLSGFACSVPNLVNCTNANLDPGVQANLKAQIAKSRADLDVLRFYPIVSFGVSYNFGVR